MPHARIEQLRAIAARVDRSPAPAASATPPAPAPTRRSKVRRLHPAVPPPA